MTQLDKLLLASIKKCKKFIPRKESRYLFVKSSDSTQDYGLKQYVSFKSLIFEFLGEEQILS